MPSLKVALKSTSMSEFVSLAIFRYVVRGLDVCATPRPNQYIWGLPREEFTCEAPRITHIIGKVYIGCFIGIYKKVIRNSSTVKILDLAY